ncbi:MAG TPA: HmuY family protein [Gemmatimonadaceae bacterium]|nr:HmuY family protein [Gemmatimonadaceae bacterium]
MARTWRQQAPVIVLVSGFALFVATLASLVASSLAGREVRTFVPTPPPAGAATRPLAGEVPYAIDTVTLDASDSRTWRRVDLVQGGAVASDSAPWDLAVRRHHMVARGGAIDLGVVALERVTSVPRTGYLPTSWGADTVTPALRRWYRYRILTHLLEPNGHVYAVRTHDGRFALLEPLGYYCPGPRAGCLTFRVRYPVASSP